MIDINELRQTVKEVCWPTSPFTVDELLELLDRLEAWENVFGHLGTPDEVGNEWHSLSDRLEAAEKSADCHKRRWMALQMHQARMRDPERTMVCDILANGELMHPTVAGDRYALPGAQDINLSDSIRQLSALLRRADIQIMKWAETYGANNPQWLPPAGDVPLLEDIAEAITLAAAQEAKP